MSGRARVLRPAVAVLAATLVALPLVAGLRPAAVKAATPPEYYANALSLTQNVNWIYHLNESGQMVGLTRNNLIARIDGQTVQVIDNGSGVITGMDDSGTIIGQQNDHAVRIDGMTVTPLPSFGGYNEGPYAIDPTGTWIVGGSNFLDGDQISWVNVGGTSTPLPDLDVDHPTSYPSKVLSDGRIYGTATTVDGTNTRFVTWPAGGGSITDLGTFNADSGSIQDVNDSGEVLANVNRGSATVAVLWDGTTAIDLPTLGGQYTYGAGLNASGLVAYVATDADNHSHAFLWDEGNVTELTMPDQTDAYIQGMNDSGQVTGGYATADGQEHGFLYDEGTMYDIDGLLPASSVHVKGANTITNSGYILAYGDSGTMILLIPGQRPAARYAVIDIEAAGLGANSQTYVTDMNASGHVIGQKSTSHYGSAAYLYDGTTASVIFDESVRGYFSDIADNGVIFGSQLHNGQTEAFSYDGTTHFLGTLGGDSSSKMGNLSGDVVGTYSDAGGVHHAFLYRDGSMTQIPMVHGNGSEAFAINEAGLAIGYSFPGSYGGSEVYGFVSDGTTTTDLGTFGGTFTFPYAINEAGEIAGQSASATVQYVAFHYANGTMTDVSPAGSSGSWALDINESGAILGTWLDASQKSHAYIYDHGAFTMLPGMGGDYDSPVDMNDRGWAVGSASTVYASHGWLYDDTDYVDLTTAAPLGYQYAIADARKINNDGSILAIGEDSHHGRHALLLVPTTPLPPLPPPPVHATPAHPTVATVTSPNPGAVTVTEAATNDTPPVGSGYTFLGHQLNITAPAADATHPISIVVTVDATLLASVTPNLTAADIAVFRNGVLVAGCTPAADPATPDPCVSDRTTLSGGADAGDARITILTSTASHWNVGFVATAPGAPTGVTAVRGDKQATISWTAAAANRSPISGYTVTSTPGNKTATVGGSATSAIVTGLTNGTSYTFTVKATNGIGQGPASTPSNAVTPGVLLNQTITFPKPGNQFLTTPTLTVPLPTSTSGLPVTLASTSPSICTVSGLDIALLAVGTCAITASQAGDGTYKPATLNRTFTISLAPQKITFTKPANVMIWATPLEIIATVDSPLPITLTTSTPAVCNPAGGMFLQLDGPGTCSVTASQPGNAVYAPANVVNRTFTVSQGTQAITFPKPAAHTVLDAPFDVTAWSDTGNTVTMTSNSTAICNVSGLTVTVSAVGTCSLTATLAASLWYKAATPVTRTFNVTKAPQTITIPDPGPQSLGVHTVVLSPSASSGLTVTLSTQTAAVCTVSGNTVTLVKVGVCKIKGVQAGSPIYDPAPAIVRQFNVTT